MTDTLVLLKGAIPESVPDEHLPVVPSWWPLQPNDAAPLTEQQRAAARLAKAQREAAAGPYDGQRMAIDLGAGGPPATMRPLGQHNVQYRLDDRASKTGRLVYRYDTASPIHPQLMRAVEAAYDELGPEYVTTARAETLERP